MSINIHNVTLEEYANSVVAFMNLVMKHQGTSGAYAAAQVLLSAYNGNHFQLDITDLCNLDETNMVHAMNIIVGRKIHWKEPHTLLKNGNELFDKLHDKYLMLHIGNRNLKECWHCSGAGWNYVENDLDPDDETTEECVSCDGAGRINEPYSQHPKNIGNKFKGETA